MQRACRQRCGASTVGAAQPRLSTGRGADVVGETHVSPGAEVKPGELVRRTRRAKGLTLAQLGLKTGYSAAQVSRYERGIVAMNDVDVRRRFADALELPHEAFGLAVPATRPEVRHGQAIEATVAFPRLPAHRVGRPGWEDGEDPVRRRRLLANLAITAAAAAGAPLLQSRAARADDAQLGELLVAELRDAMLGLGSAPSVPPIEALDADFSRARADFDACRYADLVVRLPRLIRMGHALTVSGDGSEHYGRLAQTYLMATRMLVKLDEQQLGWMAADRARQLADAATDVLGVAESARQLAVLARKAGWHDQALSIALTAADDPALRDAGRDGAAERGLLIQSAAYTVARRGDRSGMRELTDEATAIAKELGGRPLLRGHGGGFSPLTVQLHRISAENHAGDPLAALAAANSISLAELPSLERRSRGLGDIALTLERLGRRRECVRALLAAEHYAPQETHARPAVKSLISSLLVSGPTSSELRGLAARSGVVA
ncbi:helix-turn-helix domain-containing protein [Streptomyces sp. NPDC058471]|uniref:helix-turn-helix domain-containing protein n=1 Tax=Streptomyces sp. NPDC058471 TaxID=3346516 RepID=UPI0036521BD6